MGGSSAERKTFAPTEDRRGLECRHCTCRHFRLIYTRQGWAAKLICRWECRHCQRRITTLED